MRALVPRFIFSLALLAFATAIPPAPAKNFTLGPTNGTNAPLVLAFYHPWYNTPWGPSQRWRKWDSFKFPERYRPDRVLDGWRRDIASGDYPLIGPYDVTDPEVVRWHFRLAKAAGIDGFITSWWKIGTSDSFWDWQYQQFDQWLRIAAEEDFAICVLDEAAHYVRSGTELLSRVTTHLPRYAASRGYLHINGQPAWYVYQVWDDWLLASGAAEYVRDAEARLGGVFWMFDKMKAVAASEPPGARLTVGEEWLKVNAIDCFGAYSLFANWRATNRVYLERLYTQFTQTVRRSGRFVLLPVLPGHDNTAVSADPYVAARQDGVLLRDFLRAADAAKADIVAVCSFNEWFEMTTVEPAANWPDPYLYLKIIAAWRKKEWRRPPLPPEASMDALMLPQLREKGLR